MAPQAPQRSSRPGEAVALLDFARGVTAVLLQQVVNGVTIGVVYALIAVGLTLVFGILDVINFAHGEFYMLGAFLTYSLVVGLGLDYFAALAVALAGAAAAGLIAQRLTVIVFDFVAALPAASLAVAFTLIATFRARASLRNAGRSPPSARTAG